MSNYLLIEIHTGAMDGCYHEQEKAEEIRDYHERRHEGTKWIVVEVSKEERTRISPAELPNDYVFHADEPMYGRLIDLSRQYREHQQSTMLGKVLEQNRGRTVILESFEQ